MIRWRQMKDMDGGINDLMERIDPQSFLGQIQHRAFSSPKASALDILLPMQLPRGWGSTRSGSNAAMGACGADRCGSRRCRQDVILQIVVKIVVSWILMALAALSQSRTLF